MSSTPANEILPRALPAPLDVPLLVTKLRVPPAPEWLLARPRLLERLTEGTEGPLTLVAAPAGAGKTMLLGSWVRARRLPGPVTWLSLDPDDNDPSRFWAYVLAGLRTSGAVPPDSSLATLAPPRPGILDGFLPLLVNGFGELRGPVVVVLDDVHELTDKATLTGVEFLVRHAPPTLRLVLASRADPALPLGRLRVAGAVTEVRATELAFTRAEATELLTGLGAAALSDADATALWTRTEGWAAGLRLAALSLQHHPDPSGFVAAFSGDDRAVADYLLGEVLDRQPAEVRDFLLSTSVADRLTGGLADALTGGRDGARRLAELERINAFVVPLDPHRTAYRYHQLFAELLRAELRHRGAQEVAELHRRAARWHAANGVTVDGIRHALTAEDWESARSLLVERWPAVIATSVLTLRDLLQRLPAHLIRDDPELAMIGAHIRLDLDDLDGADAYLRLADASAAAVPEDRKGRFAVAVAVARLHRARLLGDLDGASTIGRELLECAPMLEETSQWFATRKGVQMVGLSNLGAAELWSGDFQSAAAHLEEGLAMAEGTTVTAGEEFAQLNCLSQFALLEVARGRLRRALERGQAAVTFAERRGWSHDLNAFGGHLALAWAHCHQGDVAAASRDLERGSQTVHERTAMVAAALVQSWLLATQGKPDTGLRVLRAAIVTVQAAGWQPPQFLAELMRTNEARLLVAIGDLQAARVLLVQADDGGSLGADAAVALARLQLAEGDPAGAADTVAPVLDGGPASTAHPIVLLDAWLLDAVVRAEAGAHDQAARSLEGALALAAAEGYRQVFIDGGAPVRALLAGHLERVTDHAALVAELLGLVGQQAPGARSPSGPKLVEPLSEREQTVLRYLASILTAGEIASELYVSPNTVKTHIKSIYRKLGANGRREAVNQARRLGLL